MNVGMILEIEGAANKWGRCLISLLITLLWRHKCLVTESEGYPFFT